MSPTLSEIDRKKTALRERMRTARGDARKQLGDNAFELGAQNFLEAVRLSPGECIAGYWPIGDEFDPRPLLSQISARGGNLALPAISATGTRLSFRSWRPGDPLTQARFGTMEPSDSREPIDPAILIVPLLAFDRRGNRLGYGGGYYDRTLAALRRSGGFKLAVGLAFGAQRVPRVPTENNDQKLDAVVTEETVIWIGQQTA